MNKIIEKIQTYFTNLNKYAFNSYDVELSSPTDIELNNFTVMFNGQKIQFSINNNTITIDTTMNIVVNSNLFAVKTENGIHLNPDFLNVEELKQRYMLSQKNNIIEHQCDGCKEELKTKRIPFKQKLAINNAKRDQKFKKE